MFSAVKMWDTYGFAKYHVCDLSVFNSNFIRMNKFFLLNSRIIQCMRGNTESQTCAKWYQPDVELIYYTIIYICWSLLLCLLLLWRQPHHKSRSGVPLCNYIYSLIESNVEWFYLNFSSGVFYRKIGGPSYCISKCWYRWMFEVKTGCYKSRIELLWC